MGECPLWGLLPGIERPTVHDPGREGSWCRTSLSAQRVALTRSHLGEAVIDKPGLVTGETPTTLTSREISLGSHYRRCSSRKDLTSTSRLSSQMTASSSWGSTSPGWLQGWRERGRRDKMPQDRSMCPAGMGGMRPLPKHARSPASSDALGLLPAGQASRVAGSDDIITAGKSR